MAWFPALTAVTPFFPFYVIPGEDVVHSTPGLEAARALQEFKLEMEFAT